MPWSQHLEADFGFWAWAWGLCIEFRFFAVPFDRGVRPLTNAPALDPELFVPDPDHANHCAICGFKLEHLWSLGLSQLYAFDGVSPAGYTRWKNVCSIGCEREWHRKLRFSGDMYSEP